MKLKAESSGILNWCLAGCRDWQRDGLGEPEEVRQATAGYQAEQDTLAAFIAECCLVNREVKCRASTLLDAYQKWSGDKLMTAKLFGQKLEAKGYQNSRGHGGFHLWHGIGLPADDR